MKHSEVQRNAEQFAVYFLIENLFCIYTVSNLSSKVCLGLMKHASKACMEIHDLDPSSSYCAPTTNLQKYFPFVWICVTSVAIVNIYYSKWPKDWWAFRTHRYTPAQLNTKDYRAALSVWESNHRWENRELISPKYWISAVIT